MLDVVDLGVEAFALGPPRVHAQQHLRPVLTLGAPAPALIVAIASEASYGPESSASSILSTSASSPRDRGDQLRCEIAIDLVGQELVDRHGVVDAGDEPVVPGDLVVQTRERST